MKKYLFAMGAALVAGAVTAPAAALGAKVPGNEGGFVAMTEVGGDGLALSVPVRPGETVPVTIGVVYNGNVSPPGAVLKVRVVNDVHLSRTYNNCWYFVNGGAEGAWCRLDQRLTMVTSYAVAGFAVSAGRDARGRRLGPIDFQWLDRDYGAEVGGIKALAERDAGPGTTPFKGTGGPAVLVEDSKVVRKDLSPAGTAYVHLVTPATSAPTTTAPAALPAITATPVDTSPAIVAAAAPDVTPAPGGGLPITGSKTMVYAVAGLLLVLVGAVAVGTVRRRRTRFTA